MIVYLNELKKSLDVEEMVNKWADTLVKKGFAYPQKASETGFVPCAPGRCLFPGAAL